jgi:hypothetical protein
MMEREQFLLPDFHSKFVNRETLLQMYQGLIFAIKTADMTFCICARPPSKLVLIQKMEQYLSISKLKSGIDMSRGNFPDKKWLVQAIATLSLG